METTARDVMDTKFHTLSPRSTIADAVKLFKRASLEEGKKIFGMMVTDDNDELVGMLSMYDILLYIRPKHIQIWGEMDDIDPTGLFDAAIERAGSLQVGDIMTGDLVTITPDTHLMVIVDIMIKKHIRRLPVLDGRRIVGIVYISDVFYHLLQSFV